MARIQIDWFLVSLFGAITLSFVYPNIGAKDGPLHLDAFAKWGIFVIFFLHGAKLSIAQIKTGLYSYKLHITSQAIVFIIFPLLGIILYYICEGFLSQSQRLGIVFLSAISSTISSSIVLTNMAGGNTAGTIFSATISGIIGIFITPLIIAIFYAHSNQIDALSAIIEIMKLILLPLFIGQVFRPLIKSILEKRKQIIANLDRGIIIIIVFSAFCDSNSAGIFSQTTVTSLIIISLLVVILLIASLFVGELLSNLFGLSSEDKISVIFVGATKSLANGVPIATVLFAQNPNIGIIILPLMLYHPLQLMVCAWLARRYNNSAR